jgi:magnesium transporter
MSTAYLTADATLTLSEVRSRLLGHARRDVLEIVLILDPDGRLKGVADMRDVLAGPAGNQIGTLIMPDWPTLHPKMSQDHAAQIAAGAGVSCLPVVDANGRPVGCVPPHSLIKVLAREHHEDVHRLVGMLRDQEGARHALEDPPLRRVSQRLPWLVIGLVLSSAGAALMAGFERILASNLVIAFFIPSLVYLADAIGTQSEAVAVRGLSILNPRPISQLLRGELITGTVIGFSLGLLAFIAVGATYRDLKLAFGVGLSMTAAGSLASGIGLMLPWLLYRLGVDPAFGSGPVATIIQDTLTILVYFLVMAALLPAP